MERSSYEYRLRLRTPRAVPSAPGPTRAGVRRAIGEALPPLTCALSCLNVFAMSTMFATGKAANYLGVSVKTAKMRPRTASKPTGTATSTARSNRPEGSILEGNAAPAWPASAMGEPRTETAYVRILRKAVASQNGAGAHGMPTSRCIRMYGPVALHRDKGSRGGRSCARLVDSDTDAN